MIVEQEQGNKLIAEFNGWSFEVKPDEFGGELFAYHNGNMKWRGEKPGYLNKILVSPGFAFHEDFNKLMEVVEKLDEYGVWTIRPTYV